MNKRWMIRREEGGAFVNLIVLLCIAVFFFLLYLVRHPIMRYVAETWVIDEPSGHADAIILLSDDNFYADRASRVAELSRQEVAPVVVASGRRLRPNAGLSEVMEHDLIERGVPKNKILRFDHTAADTIEEARLLAKLAQEKRWHKVIIVSSNYHTRRVRYISGRVFPSSIAVSVAAARDAEFDPDHWWEKRRSVILFGHEFMGMLDAWWELHGKQGETTAGALFWRLPGWKVTRTYTGCCGKRRTCALHTVSAVLC
jgi:uncharacterized SAM-binding protein YcdF (DUF218 family)